MTDEEISKVIETLPPGDWAYYQFKDCVLLMCPEHQPRTLRNGAVSEIEFSAYEWAAD